MANSHFKEVTMTPWKTACIDLIGPYPLNDRLRNDSILNVMEFVDQITVWLEITEFPDKIIHSLYFGL